jgi:hypothetical protein
MRRAAQGFFMELNLSVARNFVEGELDKSKGFGASEFMADTSSWFRPPRWGLNFFLMVVPAVETAGYFRMFLWNKSAAVTQLCSPQ